LRKIGGNLEDHRGGKKKAGRYWKERKKLRRGTSTDLQTKGPGRVPRIILGKESASDPGGNGTIRGEEHRARGESLSEQLKGIVHAA